MNPTPNRVPLIGDAQLMRTAQHLRADGCTSRIQLGDIDCGGWSHYQRPIHRLMHRNLRAALLVGVVALIACATVRVGTIQRSYGPQIRARQVSVTFTKELP